MNFNLQDHYKKLYSESLEKIKKENFGVDEQIDSESDNRYGITLLFRPPNSLKRKIQNFLAELKKIEPAQYYYRNSDIHVTVMSIISCYSGFQLEQIDLKKYVNIISESIINVKKFEIHFRGVTASQAGIMIQGFPKNESLNKIRKKLRENFKKSDLEQSLDKRYSIQTAHSTVVRFRKEVKKKKEFLGIINEFREFNFGSFKVDILEFVGNDWYQKKEKVELLRKFSLSN